MTNPGRVPRYFFSAADQCPLEAPDSQTNRALVGYVAPGSSVPWVYAVECYLEYLTRRWMSWRRRGPVVRSRW